MKTSFADNCLKYNNCYMCTYFAKPHYLTISIFIKTHDSESRGQEEPATTE